MSERQREGDQPDGNAKPDSTGPNSRPRDETIAQTGPGIPDDTSEPVEVDPRTEERIAEKIGSL